jgi:hypothetical protein
MAYLRGGVMTRVLAVNMSVKEIDQLQVAEMELEVTSCHPIHADAAAECTYEWAALGFASAYEFEMAQEASLVIARRGSMSYDEWAATVLRVIDRVGSRDTIIVLEIEDSRIVFARLASGCDGYGN